MSIKTLLLVGAMSLAAASAAYATDGPGSPTDGTGRSHASAAPACGYECPVLAGDGGPGGINDGNGRSMASATARSGRIPALWRPVLAGGGKVGSDFHANAAPVCDSDRCQILADDTGPISAGDHNGRSSSALSQGGAKFLVASIRGGSTGDF
jgi:hypothetical protein